MRFRSILFLCLLLGFSIASAEEAKSGSPLRSTLVLERGSLTADDTVSFQLWLGNEGDTGVEGLRLHLSGPGFLSLGDERCSPRTGNSVDLGGLGPQEVRGVRLCLRSGEVVEEGDFNLLFTLEHRWQEAGKPRSSFIAIEKSVAVGLFGTETVGGVSLRLAALIVPGILFLGLLQLFRIDLPARVTAVDKAALSVLVSAVLIWLTTVLRSPGTMPGISLSRFLLLCLMAAAAAGLFGAVALIYRRWMKRRLVVDRFTLLRQVFKKRTTVKNMAVHQGGEDYIGSAILPLADGGGLLVGWFELAPDDTGLRTELTSLHKEGEWMKILNKARKARLTVGDANPIKKREADGTLSDTKEYRLRVSVPSLGEAKETEDGPAQGPLTIA